MLDKFTFLLGESFQGMRRNLTMTLATIFTVAIALFLLGGLAYLYQQTDKFARDLTGRFEMRAYFTDGAEFARIKETVAAIRKLEGVRTVQHIPRDAAWKRERERLGPEITSGLANPLPDAVKITLSDLNLSSTVEKAVENLPAIDKERGVVYMRDEQRFLEQTRSLLQWLATGLGGLLLVTSGILIYNAVRLAIIARRTEMRVMSLVGASRTMVRTPYLLEGIAHGLLGGLLAVFLLAACRAALESRLLTLSTLSNLPPFPWAYALQNLLVAGALFGLLCSYLALLSPSGRQ